ncbi:MAG: 30S ribosomal protein S6 [Puniceicoccales bacterium]|jgi:small subunit ribosomal protein S6|nr:30S ribosomal protein S6 [Puniceicoccales bacterium]
MSDARKYTASFVLDMRGCTDTAASIIDRLSGIIVDLGGQVSSAVNLGQKNFERVTDKKFSSGIYVQISFEGGPTIVEGIKSKLRLDKVIDRILVEAAK